MKRLIRVLKAISDPNRMRILKMLQHRELCVCEITEALGIAQPSVSRHMRILLEADLVVQQRDGLWINYRWNPSPEDPYSRDLLAKIGSWLEEDPDIRGLLRRFSELDREAICAKRKPRGKGAARREATR